MAEQGPVEQTVGSSAGEGELRNKERRNCVCATPRPGGPKTHNLSGGPPTVLVGESGLKRRGRHWVSIPGSCPLVLWPCQSLAWWVVEAGTGDGVGEVMGGDQQGLGKWDKRKNQVRHYFS